MEKDENKKILVRFPGALCDIVQALPLLVLIKEHFPQSHLSVLVQQKDKGIFNNLNIDAVIGFHKKPRFAPVLESGKDLITFIQRQQYDLGIILPNSFSSAYIFYLGMVKRRIGFKRPLGSFMLTDRIDGEDYIDILKPLGMKVGEWVPRLPAKRVNHSYLHIGFSSFFDKKFSSKRWYKELIDFIAEEIPYVKISILECDKRDDTIEGKINTIHNLDVFVADDKGLLAVAKAVETPSVDISGLIKQQQILPEDFFLKIKEALLKPLQENSVIHCFSQYDPITKGTISKNSTKKISKKVGVIILAGGMGRRLGLLKPKGLLSIGGRCLYDILLEKAAGADKIGILTSPITHKATEQYLNGKSVDLFEKKVYPTQEGDGVSPEGNGALFDALVHSPNWEEWKKLDIISVIAVDNPLANPMESDLLATEKELAVIGVERERDEERLGVLCKKGDDLAVREYFTLGKDGMEGLGYSGSFAGTPAFFERVAFEHLPFYRVQKKDKVFYERLLIDGFIFARNFDVIEKTRAECFFPIKEKRDITAYYEMLTMKGEKK